MQSPGLIVLLQKAKKVVKIVIIYFVVVIILLIVIDPFFKASNETLTRRSVVLREHPPFSDEYYTPSEHYLLETENLVTKTYRLRTNKDGFIIGEKDEPNSSSADIIFFGGSTTECLFVEEEKRFPYLVGEKLKSNNLSLHPVVYNGGTSGNCSSHSTINLLVKGIHLSPKIVVLMHNINDLQLLLKTGDYNIGPQFRTFIIDEEVQPRTFKLRLEASVRSTLDLFVPNISRLAKKAYEKLINSAASIDEWAGFRDNIFSYNIVENKFERSVLSFIRMAKSQDIEVVLMTQFSRLKPSDEFIRNTYDLKQSKSGEVLDFDSLCYYFDNLNQTIREIASEEDLLLIDLARAIPADSTYIYDMVHLNTSGSILAANIIAEQLQNRYYSIKK